MELSSRHKAGVKHEDESPWKYPAGNGTMRNGRNSLLESAQKATRESVAMRGFQRQSPKGAQRPGIPHYKRQGGAEWRKTHH